MARKSKENILEEKVNAVASYMKANKDKHFNDEEDYEYLVSTGSLLLDAAIEGAKAGCHRMIGVSTGGKTSHTLEVCRNFLNTIPNSRAYYFKSEGRLSKNMQDRSGVKFTKDYENHYDGECLVVESNIYEFIFTLIRTAITNNPENKRYMFIIDSADNMIREEDLKKEFTELDKVAGGALLTTKFFQKTGLALSKRGHMIYFLSQQRDFVKVDPRQKTPQRQGNSSGANSLVHQNDLCLEFLKRTEFDKDFIREDPNDKNSKILGHWCKVRIHKTDNEKYETTIKYPIKYGRVNGKSVWKELEVVDILLQWSLLKKSGGWFSFDEGLLKELEENKIECQEKIQGLNNVYQYFESNESLTEYLFKKFSNILKGEV